MDDEAIRARLRERERELASEPPLETVTSFLRAFCAGAESMEQVRTDVEATAATHADAVRRILHALELVLAEPAQEGTMARLVAWEANWALDDPSDAGARAWLEEVAAVIRDALDQAGRQPGPG